MMELKLDDAKARAVLTDAAVSVFAEMAFMDALPAEAAAAELRRAKNDVHVALDVLKPLSCRMELILSRPLADRISDTLYGMEDGGFQDGAPPSAAGTAGARSRDDSALEMLNVLAGSFLSGYFGSGTALKLELPFFVFGETDEGGPIAARADLDVEGFPAEVLLRSVRYRY